MWLMRLMNQFKMCLAWLKIVWQCITACFFVYGINRQKDKYAVDKEQRFFNERKVKNV